MSLGSEAVPFTMPVEPAGSNSNNNNGGWGGDWGAWIILFLIFGMFGWGGMGGFGGFGGFGGMGGGAYPVESILQRSLDTQTIIGKLDGVNQGLCDGFYTMQGAVNGLGMNMMQGFSQAELADAQRHAATMQQLYQMGYNQQDCCCQTKQAIAQVNYDAAMRNSESNRLMERGFCDTNYAQATNTTAIIQNAHNDTDRILAKLSQMEYNGLNDKYQAAMSENQALKFQLSQGNQNAAIGAMISASEATILRRTGAECPMPAYVVQPPQPVTFPTNCCGQVNYSGGNCTPC